MELHKTNAFIFIDIYLDQGVESYASKDLTYRGTNYVGRVLDWGTLDFSLSIPPGTVQIADLTIEIADTDGRLKGLFDGKTPFQRIASLYVDWEENKDIPPPHEPIEMGDIPWPTPVFTGEIVPGSVKFPLGRCQITFKSVTASWLDRQINGLITRKDFRNLPDDVEWEFAPIIFGDVRSQNAVGFDPQGVVYCPHVDTTLHRYMVARHPVQGVSTVYRRKKLENRFKAVPAAEYEVLQHQNKDINGITYPFTYIHFFKQQDDNTVVHADVQGINYYYDFDHGVLVAGLATDPTDCLVVLLAYLLEDEIDITAFSSPAFIQTRVRTVAKHYAAAGAITAQSNAKKGPTVKEVISQLCGDFLIDFFQDTDGLLKVWLYDEELDGAGITVDTDLSVQQTFTPALPEKVFTRFRYRYFRQNALLQEFIHSAASGQWGYEETVDNIQDQAELGATGKNPLLEEILEQFFIRDNNVAQNTAKRHFPFFNIRTYPVTFTLPAPAVVDSLGLAQPVTITHPYGGIADGGNWEEIVAKVKRVTYRLNAREVDVEVLAMPHVSDTVLEFSYDIAAGHPVHDAQIRQPNYAVTANASEADPEDPGGSATVNLVTPDNSYIEDPTVFIDAPIVGDDFADPPAVSSPTERSTFLEQYSPVYWLERIYDTDGITPLSKREVSGWVRKDNSSVLELVGTLSPDTRPTDLIDADAYTVKFYSKDFDHWYWWVGTIGDYGTSSGWRAIEQTCRTVFWKEEPPVGPGWEFCDGSTVLASDHEGNVSNIVLPDYTSLKLVAGDSSAADLTVRHVTNNASLPTCLLSTAYDEIIHTHLPYMRL